MTNFDPAALAKSVRELAYDARRILNDPTHQPYELRALSRRITFLKDQVAGHPTSDLARWLESLLRQVPGGQGIERRRSACRGKSTPLGVG